MWLMGNSDLAVSALQGVLDDPNVPAQFSSASRDPFYLDPLVVWLTRDETPRIATVPTALLA